jgi:hypothetical protein
VGGVVTDWTRDQAREVCLEVLATASVCGVPLEAGADVLADAIGRPFTQEYYAEGRSMTRDWGLLRAYYHRPGPGTPWACHTLTVYVHRLGKPFRWRRIPAELQAHGFTTADVPSRDTDLQEIGVPASGAVARVTATDYYQPAGRVLDISAGRSPFLDPVVADRRGELRNRLRETAGAGPSAWTGLATVDPAAWLGALRKLHADEPARDEQWTALSLWLLDRAREARVWPVEEWTYRWARYVADRPGVAAPGEVTRACLAALPMDVAEARALPAGWREVGPDAARRARVTRALLRLAADQAPDGKAADQAPDGNAADLAPDGKAADQAAWRTETAWLP